MTSAELVPSWLVAMAADDNRERLLQLRAFMIGIGEDPDDPLQWARRKRQYCARSGRRGAIEPAVFWTRRQEGTAGMSEPEWGPCRCEGCRFEPAPTYLQNG